MENWESHCQLMLKASYGMDYSDFYKFLSFIVKKRLKALKNQDSSLESFGKWKIGPRHCLFDINRAKIVLKYLIDDTKEKNIHDIIFPDNNIHDLITEINEQCI